MAMLCINHNNSKVTELRSTTYFIFQSVIITSTIILYIYILFSGYRDNSKFVNLTRSPPIFLFPEERGGE
jgi:hypothetical protein